MPTNRHTNSSDNRTPLQLEEATKHIYEPQSHSGLGLVWVAIRLIVTLNLHSLDAGFVDNVLDVVTVLADDFS